MLDLQRIGRRRHQMKEAFSESDYVHREIADRLIDRLELIRLVPHQIVVYGWQTKAEVSLLQKRYPSAKILSVSCLKELDSIPENSTQLVVSNLSLEWENEPKAILSACHRVLSNEGLLLFSTLGPDTGKELRESFLVVDESVHVHTFVDMHHIGDALKQLHFDDPVVDMEVLTLAYDDIDELCLDLKNVAARNAHQDRRKGLMTLSQWTQMKVMYESFKVDGYLPFTLEVIYGHAWKVHRPEADSQEITIPISAIKK